MERTRRLKVVKYFFGGAWFALLAYIFLVQVVFGRKYSHWAKSQHEEKIELLSDRGVIYDHNGQPLVINSSCCSIYILPQYLTSPEKAAEVLARHQLGGYSPILDEIKQNKRFFWFTRKIDYQAGQAVAADLKKAGLSNAVVVVEDTKRTYPWRQTLGSVLGFLGDDQKGLAGVEYSLNDVLAGEAGWAIDQKDPLGNDYRYPSYPVQNPKAGDNVYLTIDLDLQQIAFAGLKAVVDSVAAKKGMVVVLAPTGAVLALVDYPDFDPNDYQHYQQADWKCAAVSNEFEPGSSFKHIIAATCLEYNLADTCDTIDTRPGSLKIGGYTISDVHSYGRLSFSGIFEQSSNVGVSKLSFNVNPKLFYETARRLGFGAPTGIELPAEGAGLLDKPNRLNRLRLANNSFGQGVRCTAIQLAASYLAIANGGFYKKPFLVEKITDGSKVVYQANPQPIRKALQDTTCLILKEILARVVEKGTGKNAKLDVVPVCGKTGTAQKAVEGGYSSDKLNLSFVGFFPKDNPELLIAIVIDEPAKPYYASEVACPLFKKIGEQSLRLPQYALSRSEPSALKEEPGSRNEPSALKAEPGSRNGPSVLKEPGARNSKPGVQKTEPVVQKTEPTSRNEPSAKKNLVQNAKFKMQNAN